MKKYACQDLGHTIEEFKGGVLSLYLSVFVFAFFFLYLCLRLLLSLFPMSGLQDDRLTMEEFKEGSRADPRIVQVQ